MVSLPHSPREFSSSSYAFSLVAMKAKGHCAEHGVWETTDPTVVAKAYGIYQRAYWEREVEALEKLVGVDISVRFHGSCEGALPDGTPALLIFEENVPQSLRGWMKANKGKKLTVESTTKFVKGIAKMHRRKVWHRDMNVSNIHMRADGSLALFDFGRLRDQSEEEMTDDDLVSLTLQPLYAKLDLGVPSAGKKKKILAMLDV